MITLWFLLLATAVQTETVGNEDHNVNIQNVTTLYPVSNKTELYYKRNESAFQINKLNKFGPVSWKIDASYAESNLNNDKNATDIRSIQDVKGSEEGDADFKEFQYIVQNNTDSKEANLAADFVGNFENYLEIKDGIGAGKQIVKDFRPSQPLGTFFDEEFVTISPPQIYATNEREPKPGFISSPPDFIPRHKPSKPPNIIPEYQAFPYKYETPMFSKAKGTWEHDILEAKPTVASPEKVPAGGLYKLTDPFQDRPVSNEDLGPTINGDYKEDYHIKKRADPWKNLLHLITAFIPVGLIISALTPNVITIQNTGPKNPNSNIYRRSEIGIPHNIAPISEQCRRRLLCELRSETNYASNSNTRRKGKQCYKIHCEDSHTIQKMLHWLFNYYKPGFGQTDFT